MPGVDVVVQAPPNAQNIVIANQRMTLTVAATPSPIPSTIDCNSTRDRNAQWRRETGDAAVRGWSTLGAIWGVPLVRSISDTSVK